MRVPLVSNALLAMALLAVACPATAGGSAARSNVPMVQDWSTHQAMFRDPMTPEEASARGRTERWRRLAADPRYLLRLMQKLEREAAAGQPRVKARAGVIGKGKAAQAALAPLPPTAHRDWSNVLGGGSNGMGGSGVAGVYPAKFSFDINAAPDCDNDFVVYGTNAPGATQSVGAVAEVWTGNFTGNPGNNRQFSLNAGSNSRSAILVSSNTSNTGLNFLVANGAHAFNATNLADAVNRWTAKTGFTAVANAGGVGRIDISKTTAGNALDSQLSENVNGFSIASSTNGSGTPGQASILAFNRLYRSTCEAAPADVFKPAVYWAYNTGGTVRTSPVLSYFDNAKQVAFVQSNSSNQAELVLLRYRVGDGGTPGNPLEPAIVTPTQYRTKTGACASQACMVKFLFNRSADVTYSSPFVDYFNNTLYVGDDQGVLHKFIGIFRGALNPAEVVVLGGFPVLVSAGNTLSPPVYDFGGNVWVGSKASGAFVSEEWNLAIVAGGGLNTTGQALTVNGVTFVTATDSVGNHINVNLAAAAECALIALKINTNVPGFSASCTSPNVRIRRTPPGDVNGADFISTALSNATLTNTVNGTADGTGGKLHRIDASAVVTDSEVLSPGNSPGVRFSPMLDVTGQAVYAFVGNDRSLRCLEVGCRAIIQFPIPDFATGSTGISRQLGQGNALGEQLTGAFDSEWYSSPDSTGAIYACGATATNSTTLSLWKIPLSAGVIGSAQQGAIVSASGGGGGCSPLTSVRHTDTGIEYLHFSLGLGGVDGDADVCVGPCLYVMDLSDLNGGLPDLAEVITLEVQNNGGDGPDTAGETLELDHVMMVTAADNVGNNIDISGNRTADCLSFATRIPQLVAGFDASCNLGNFRVTITAQAAGDYVFTEGVSRLQVNGPNSDDGAGGSAWNTSNDPAEGLRTPAGTGGIIIDNISNAVGASQVYFAELGATGNAVQAGQIDLQ